MGLDRKGEKEPNTKRGYLRGKIPRTYDTRAMSSWLQNYEYVIGGSGKVDRDKFRFDPNARAASTQYVVTSH